MSEFKGTKGRFIINKNEILNSENELIAIVYGYMVKGIYTYTEETKANVLLFSKAPEMLEMLKRCEYWISACNEDANILKDISELIKEATEF
mgnify:CR=1 FL=1